MPSLSGYQRELSFPLISGIHEDPPWTTFMQRLVEQTYARRGILVITLSNAMSSQPPAVVQVRAGRAAQEPPIDFQRISAMGLIPFGIMRPGRVYALDEMLDHGDATRRDQQRGVLKAMGICYGRWLRIAAAGVADAWLLLVREQDDFSAFASSLLSSLAPHFVAALQVLGALTAQRLSSKMANRALEKVGVGQIAFDGTGRVIAADALSEAHLSFLPEPAPASGRRLQLRPEVAREMETACGELARGAGALRRLVYLGAQLDCPAFGFKPPALAGKGFSRRLAR